MSCGAGLVAKAGSCVDWKNELGIGDFRHRTSNISPISQSETKEEFIQRQQRILESDDGISSIRRFVQTTEEQKKLGVSDEDIRKFKEERFKDSINGGLYPPAGCLGNGCAFREVMIKIRQEFGLPSMTDEELKEYPTLGDYYDRNKPTPKPTPRATIQLKLNVSSEVPQDQTNLRNQFVQEISKSLGVNPERVQIQSIDNGGNQ